MFLRQALRQVRQILDAAVADGIVASNPAKVTRAPQAPRRRAVDLTNDDVRNLLMSGS